QEKEQVQKSTGGNYPSPGAIIDCVQFGLTSSKQVGSVGVSMYRWGLCV
ncbi:unnamed protein product, partial [Discosporangium mesarthrocarpum]